MYRKLAASHNGFTENGFRLILDCLWHCWLTPHLTSGDRDLRNNQLNGTFDLGGEGVSVMLEGNPICRETGVTKSYCTVSRPNSSYATPPKNCVPSSCLANQHSSPNCKCAFPYTGLLVFRAPLFSNLGNITYFSALEKSLMDSFKSHQLPVDSVHLSQPRKDPSQYLDLNLQVFPFGQDRFNRTAISRIGFVLSNQTFKPPAQFGPFFFAGDTYLHFTGGVIGSKKSSSRGVIIGAAAGWPCPSAAVAWCWGFMLMVRKREQTKQLDKTVILVLEVFLN
ncbi:hypothetical protein OIU84_004776 [Salix udensis]|uniref:Uncharacterized protein n=1 Tax=Salix udensis TaxID=889485 RepID=A0AAD6K300_9ROSI|nr:hypothetical protein OIU84_004776 [Salix udensis]